MITKAFSIVLLICLINAIDASNRILKSTDNRNATSKLSRQSNTFNSFHSKKSKENLKFNEINSHSTSNSESFKESRKISTRMLRDDSLPVPHSVHELQQHVTTRGRQLVTLGTELAPLYPGYGTHFVYLYVGTPPQRQSVIIDTGSHFTAFPCTGCSQCGQHTDPYFDWKNSSTAVIPDCKGKPCVLSQSYSEGSSWRAFKVVDQVYVGALEKQLMPSASSYNVPFEFGCQTSETGLFRTQLADGIMGLAMAEDTLPYVLHKAGITESKIFSLCFRVGGGIFTLGGVDQRVHQKPGIYYAKLLSGDGWYQLNLLDIQLQEQGSGEVTSISTDKAAWTGGKGCIVDSGTTDTYLPSSLAAKFSALFKEVSGTAYTTANIVLSPEQLSSMPNILFTFEGVDGDAFTIGMPWTSYVDSVGGGQGVVLGANFMNGYNIIFDSDGKKVGFAKSNCKYEEFMVPITRSPTFEPTPGPGEVVVPPISDGGCVSSLVPVTECDAYCYQSDGITIKGHTYAREYGNQTWQDSCGKENPESGRKPCSITCKDGKLARGDPDCLDNAWSVCDKHCIQFRDMPIIDGGSHCKYNRQTRTCYSSLCPYQDGDYLIYIDMRLGLDPRSWSYVHTEALYWSFAKLLGVKESSIELLNDATTEASFQAKLHFQIRLKSKDYDSIEELTDAAEEIPEVVWEESFPTDLLRTLNEYSKRYDKLDHSRYGWLVEADIEVLNAAALPIGDVRDPIEIPEDGSIILVSKFKDKADLILLGVAIASLMVLCCVCCLHYRLRVEHARLEKDKGGSMLSKLWGGARKNGRVKSLFNGWGNNGGVQYKAVQMSEMIQDDELDDEEGTFDHR